MNNQQTSTRQLRFLIRPINFFSGFAARRFKSYAGFVSVAGFHWIRTQVFGGCMVTVICYFYFASSNSQPRWLNVIYLFLTAMGMLIFIHWTIYRAGEIIVLKRRVVLYDAYRIILTFFSLTFLFASLYLCLEKLFYKPLFEIEHRTIPSVDMLYVSAVKLISLGFGGSEPIHWSSKLLVLLQVVFALFLATILSSVVLSKVLDVDEDNPEADRVSDSTKKTLENSF